MITWLILTLMTCIYLWSTPFAKERIDVMSTYLGVSRAAMVLAMVLFLMLGTAPLAYGFHIVAIGVVR